MTLIDRLHRGVTTRSAAETRTVAAELSALLPADSALALHGDLGVGKTTFVQGLARGFGIDAEVTSPTFTIYTLYRSSSGGPPGFTLVHLDAYRLDSAAQMEGLLLDDFLTTPYCLAVEWPDKIAGWLPEGAWHLDLALGASGSHSLRLRPALGL